jgi:hypothetical protein
MLLLLLLLLAASSSLCIDASILVSAGVDAAYQLLYVGFDGCRMAFV